MTLTFLFKSLAWLGFFAAITLSWIFYLKARNKERLALIEKGVDAPGAFKEAKFPWLKIGIVVVSMSVGVLLVILALMLFPENTVLREALIVLMVIAGLLFGGIGMIIAHYTEKKNKV
ncbi:MAG TPA: DUF6249 domain-containing protein [Bacteroidales bacterium]|nr:DUF6249 domain-containing protein [Bacteroidales bacterium]